MLRALDDGLWVAERPFRGLGVRTTVVRLSDGGLLLHCPIGLQGGLRAEIEAIGRPSHLLAANKVHHLFLAENAAAFPEARVWLAPGLAEKRPKLPAGAVIGADDPAPWPADLDQTPIEGWPFLSETVFYHGSTQTLLITDIAFNMRKASNPLSRLVLRALGAYGHFGPSRFARVSMRDRPAIRRSIDRILEWDFERVIPTHGAIVEKNGRKMLREAYAFL